MDATEKIQTPELLQILRDRLMMAHYRLGDKLRSGEISREFKIAPGTAREVMLRLAGEGLLEYEEQRGFRVTRRSADRLKDIARFRLLLDQEGATRSIENGDIEWEASLTAAHHKLSHIEQRIARAEDERPYLKPCNDAELEFHLAVISAAEMPLLSSTYRRVYAQFRQLMVDPETGGWSRADNTREHQRILEAALTRDSARCRAALYDHLERHL
ncbi:MAG: GntR family transcriptional regulator [Pseudomonadota bacterium]